MTPLLIRLLQVALNNLPRPDGIGVVQITTRMPVNGWQAMPCIVVNLYLIKQSEVEIGEDVENPLPDNTWTLWVNATRTWRVTILSSAVDERDYYRDALLSVFRVLKATVFSQIGQNVRHSFQAESYASVDEMNGIIPGFYGADLLLTLDGVFPAALMTNYPPIAAVASNPTITPNRSIITIVDP
jgi:hypothetical protein